MVPYKVLYDDDEDTEDLVELVGHLEQQMEEVKQMGIQKFGSGQVTGTEGPLSKTASQEQFDDADQQALRQENEAADTQDEDD